MNSGEIWSRQSEKSDKEQRVKETTKEREKRERKIRKRDSGSPEEHSFLCGWFCVIGYPPSPPLPPPPVPPPPPPPPPEEELYYFRKRRSILVPPPKIGKSFIYPQYSYRLERLNQLVSKYSCFYCLVFIPDSSCGWMDQAKHPQLIPTKTSILTDDLLVSFFYFLKMIDSIRFDECRRLRCHRLKLYVSCCNY